MGLSKVAGVPHKGWNLKDVIDSRDDEGVEYDDYESCQFCDQEKIRFVHIVEHRDYIGLMRVGCVCSEHLTNDYINPKIRERLVRNQSARRNRFVKKGWEENRYGGITRKYKGYRVTIGKKSAGYRVWLDGEEGKIFFPESKQAMIAIFNHIDKNECQPVGIGQ